LTIKETFNEYRDDEAFFKLSFDQILQHSNLMLSKLNAARVKSQFVNPDLLRDLKQDAVNLSAINLLPLDSKLDDQKRENLILVLFTFVWVKIRTN
jgi:cyclic beta-1,2-glucan synthetase